MLVTRIVRVTFLPTRVPLTGAAFLGLARPSAAFPSLVVGGFHRRRQHPALFGQHGSALVRGLGRRRLDLRRLLLGRLGGRRLLRGFLGGRLLGLRERDDTCRVGSGRTRVRREDSESRRARVRFGRCAFARSIRIRKGSLGRRGRITRAYTHRLLRLFRGGGFLLRPRLLRALGGGSGWEDSNVSVRAEANNLARDEGIGVRPRRAPA